MMERKKLLIATTNEGKVHEILHVLGDLPFEFVTLKDIADIEPPSEGNESLEKNAVMKARYYAEKTGMLALADDTGLFIDALNGWPGVETARVRGQETDQFEIVLGKMKHVAEGKRAASFRCFTGVYDPEAKSYFVAEGQCGGEIAHEARGQGENTWGYNRIFYVPSFGKTFGEMTLAEKNEISHRAKSLIKIKYFLQNQYRGKHFVVPVGFLIKEGKLLMSLRNDPHRPEFHKKWEFPGGSVELGEQIEENLVREMKEETGYEVEIVRLLQGVFVKYRPEYEYQVYLLPYVCRIVGGDGHQNDAEILDMKFLELDEWLTMDLIGENLVMYKKLLQELKGVVKEFNL